MTHQIALNGILTSELDEVSQDTIMKAEVLYQKQVYSTRIRITVL